MKYTEEKIASFQLENQRWQLVKMTNQEIRTDGIPTDLKEIHFQIRKNRKVIANVKLDQKARSKFANYIYGELNQLNLFK